MQEERIVITKSQLKRLVEKSRVTKGLSLEVNLPILLSTEQEKVLKFAESVGFKTDDFVTKYKKKMNSTPPYVANMVYHECVLFLMRYISKFDKIKK